MNEDKKDYHKTLFEALENSPTKYMSARSPVKRAKPQHVTRHFSSHPKSYWFFNEKKEDDSDEDGSIEQLGPTRFRKRYKC